MNSEMPPLRHPGGIYPAPAQLRIVIRVCIAAFHRRASIRSTASAVGVVDAAAPL